MTDPAAPVDLYVSPTQIGDGLDCLRKWAWRQIEKVSTPPHRSAQAGIRIHAILENWLLYGTPPNVDEVLILDGTTYHPGRSAFNGIHHLPPPGSVFVERSFRFKHWFGRVDAIGMTLERTPVLIDHKSTGNLVNAKSEEDLLTDPQAVIYANAALAELPDAPYADLMWVYYGTMKPFPTRKVVQRLTREYAARAIEPYDRLASGLIALRTSGLRALDLPPTPAACEKYGGCPHRQRCNLSSEQLMEAHMGTEPTIEEKILAASAAVNGAARLAPAASAWVDHPEDPTGHEWNPSTGELRKKVAPTPPPIVAAAPPPIPVAPPPIPAALPIVAAAPPPIPAVLPTVYHRITGEAFTMLSAPEPSGFVSVRGASGSESKLHVSALSSEPVAPPALTPPPINAPESAGLPQKAEPTPEVVIAKPTGDDLDAMDKPALVALAAKMGVDIKGLREKGSRDKLRAARGAAVGTMPSGATVTMPPTTVQGGVPAPIAAPAAGFEPDEARLFGALEGATEQHRREYLVTLVVCAGIQARVHHDDALAAAREARSIVDAIQKVCSGE